MNGRRPLVVRQHRFFLQDHDLMTGAGQPQGDDGADRPKADHGNLTA